MSQASSGGSPTQKAANNATGADGVKIAALRKGRARFEFIWAAAQWRRYKFE